jgi:hypothetical protein
MAPVIFAPAMRLLEAWLATRLGAVSLMPAYSNKNWRRDRAPLLDHLGAVVDHRAAHAAGGGPELSNLLTACNKCNIRKGDEVEDTHRRHHPLRIVRATHGEPTRWDGLSSIFLELARLLPEALSNAERSWVDALRLARGPVGLHDNGQPRETS